jgi:hypothetical protein
MKDKATFEISGNFECKKDAPFDTRWRVDAYADLIKEETWRNKDGNVYAYSGMCTVCKDRPGKIYQLTDIAHLTDYNYWKEIGEQKLIEIINNLTSGDTNKALSAAMGKKLNDEKLDKSALTTDIVNSQDKVAAASSVFNVNTSKIDKSSIINSLDNTDTAKVLSAAQGKVLNDRIDSLGSVYKYKGNKNTIEEVLALTDAKVGDVWNVIQEFSAGGKKYPAGTNIACIKNTSTSEHSEANWDTLGGTVDLSGYATKTEMNNNLNNKVDKNDIIDNLDTNDANKPLSARIGKILNDAITDVENNIQDLNQKIPTNTSQLNNDSNFLTSARVLTKDNTDTYSPTANYHPATKKYVDDKLNGISISIVEFDYNLVNALTNTSTTEEVNAAFANRSQLKTNSIVKLISINDSSDGFDGSNGYRLCHKVNVNSPDSFIIEYFSDSNNNEVVEIIFSADNVEVNRMSIAPAIPNDILKFKYIDVTDGSLLTINKQLSGMDAYNHIIKIFGSDTAIANIVMDICENHTKYYIHSYNTNYNNIEVANSYAFYNQDDGYELQFNISYLINNGPVTKRFSIKINTADQREDLLYIEDILASDNLQRVVKRTKSEYDSITTKDNSTMYAVTE